MIRLTQLLHYLPSVMIRLTQLLHYLPSVMIRLTPGAVLGQLSDDALHLWLLRGRRQDRGVAEHAVVKSVLGLNKNMMKKVKIVISNKKASSMNDRKIRVFITTLNDFSSPSLPPARCCT